MKSNLDELKKALSETDITGKLVQNQINKVIQSLVLVNNPLRNNLPRKPGSGEGAFINSRTANPAAEVVADTDDFTAKESTYGARDEYKFKTVGVRGSVTRKAQAIGRTYTDLKTAEINASLESVKDKEEDLIINGSISSDPKEFDGLDTLIPAGQTIEAGGAGNNGLALTIGLLDQAIDKCFGMPNMMIVSKRTRREINGLLQSAQRFIDKTEVKGGFKLLSYNDIPIFWSSKISDAQTQGTSTDASSILIVDTTKVWMEVLTELRMEALARASSQYEAFDIFEDVVLVSANEKYNAKLIGIIPPA